MDFYGKSGNLNDGFSVFCSMIKPDSVSWNIIIHGSIYQELFDRGLWLFARARLDNDFEPNISTLVYVIQACRGLGYIEGAFIVHGYLVRSGFCSVCSVKNALLGVYANLCMDVARKLFDEMWEKDGDVISWSVMIGGYVQQREPEIALEMFLDMVYGFGIEVDGKLIVSVLKACTDLRSVRVGELIHGIVVSRGMYDDVFVGNSFIDFYFKCGVIDSACKAFSEMPRRNNVSWNSLLCGYVHNDKHLEALILFDSMGKEGVEADELTLVNLLQICKHYSDLSQCKLLHARIVRYGYETNDLVINSLIDVYAKCKSIDISWRLFSKAKRKDAVTWTTMIAGFNHCGMPDEAIGVCREMIESNKEFNNVTMITFLEACSLSADLRRSKMAHGIAIRRGLASDVAVGTAIVDTFSRCGAVDISKLVFDNMPQKNVVSWSAMITAYGMNGYPQNALALLAEMTAQGCKPNAVTALSALSACSHGGLVDEGLNLFKEFIHEYDLELGMEHYSCLVDMLARAGKLSSALAFMKSLPDEKKLGASAWGALLSACRNYQNCELGAGVLPEVLKLEPSSSAGYLLGSNMYAAGGSYADAVRMRLQVTNRGTQMVLGYSLTCR
ncbi:hypothetical protein LIER_27459 [Lithospermum erythrorhizon]|uniref:Pentatricopeptide repeat-containing protein n=1 Tax=Lithospermum erythrorhizon TaxID=34254 RepID=A0AAV3RDN5_LITER